MNLSTDRIADILDVHHTANLPRGIVNHIHIDSRSIHLPEKSMFVAIKGNRHDGHSFIPKLYKTGVRVFLVSEKIKQASYTDAHIFHVDDVILAMQEIAKIHRRAFDIPIIGITGSNGKTTIKEWLYQLLSPDYQIVKSPKSYNSQIGVALSIFNIDRDHQLGIFEGGISRMEEMKNIAPIIDCNIGIFTNIGSAHQEGFKSIQQKFSEKAQLFTDTKAIICCRDQQLVFEGLSALYPNRLITWSLEGKSDNINATIIDADNGGTHLKVRTKSETKEIWLPFKAGASIENAMHCLTTMVYLGYNLEALNDRFHWLKSVNLRLELIKGTRNNLIINDCYNADLESLSLALEFMDQHALERSKTLILSDVHQMNKSSTELYSRIAEMIAAKGVKKVIGVGQEIEILEKWLSPGIDQSYYSSTQGLSDHLDELNLQNEIILVKGARIFELEKITYRLQSQSHAAHLEIDLSALLHNLSTFQGLLPEQTKMMVMMKAAAYGGGSQAISMLLQYHNIDYIGVAYADEGVELREQGIRLPILVLNPDWDYLDLLYRYQLEPEVYSVQALKDVIQFQEETNQRLSIHLKVDTGMNRLGFGKEDMKDMLTLLGNSNLEVKSIFSHLAASDDSDYDEFTSNQIDMFEGIVKRICATIGYQPLRHILNSSGILRHQSSAYEMVRLGIGLYGIDPSSTMIAKLQKVHSLKAKISQIKKVPAGQMVGYNANRPVEKDRITATINIGYADGLFRSAGNGNCSFLVNGEMARTIGNICMDMSMIDITNLKGIHVGDEVEIFGKNLMIEHMAAQMGTIPYELLCGVSSRVRRLYFQS